MAIIKIALSLGERFRRDTEREIDDAVAEGLDPYEEYMKAVDDLLRIAQEDENRGDDDNPMMWPRTAA